MAQSVSMKLEAGTNNATVTMNDVVVDAVLHLRIGAGVANQAIDPGIDHVRSLVVIGAEGISFKMGVGATVYNAYPFAGFCSSDPLGFDISATGILISNASAQAQDVVIGYAL